MGTKSIVSAKAGEMSGSSSKAGSGGRPDAASSALEARTASPRVKDRVDFVDVEDDAAHACDARKGRSEKRVGPGRRRGFTGGQVFADGQSDPAGLDDSAFEVADHLVEDDAHGNGGLAPARRRENERITRSAFWPGSNFLGSGFFGFIGQASSLCPCADATEPRRPRKGRRVRPSPALRSPVRGRRRPFRLRGTARPAAEPARPRL